MVCKVKILFSSFSKIILFYINYVVCKLFITLKAILLKTQIIVTTHSPHILQIDSKEEMIVLDMAESGNVYKKELELGEYGVLMAGPMKAYIYIKSTLFIGVLIFLKFISI